MLSTGPQHPGKHIDEDALNRTTVFREIRPTTVIWNLKKLKGFYTEIETVNQLKINQFEKWERIFASNTSDIGFISRWYRKQKKSMQSINELRMSTDSFQR